ncbi:MAG: hypothetical protein J6X71_10470 [Bacteroidales bacterium]|nr:hypothetical protein [Bacteroidales bacterium]
MNNPKQNHYSAPEVKVLFIRTDQLCTGSNQTVNETANHEDYESIDLFE